MNFLEWSKSSVDYGQRLVNSALEGAHEGEGQFLQQELFTPYLSESAQHALLPAMVGALLGALGGRSGRPTAVCFKSSRFRLGGRSHRFWRGRDLGEPTVRCERRFRRLEKNQPDPR